MSTENRLEFVKARYLDEICILEPKVEHLERENCALNGFVLYLKRELCQAKAKQGGLFGKRFSHKPLTLPPLIQLLQEPRTNLCTNS
mmetsp:Transcript_2957/g.11295  ORF Transcript_2957/g.11295 Transcript_2957/m.11295 type:complete len:87 (+) Transcript_2957:3150-3410(+)